jgi:hypothetical protein
MKIRVRVGFAYHSGEKTTYERSFNKNSLEAFHARYHWQYKVRMLLLIQGEKQ